MDFSQTFLTMLLESYLRHCLVEHDYAMQTSIFGSQLVTPWPFLRVVILSHRTELRDISIILGHDTGILWHILVHNAV